MKFLLLSAMLTISSLSAFASTQIIYPNGQSAETVTSNLRITPNYFESLVIGKLSELATSGECGIGESEKFLSATFWSEEDTAQEEISYHSFNFEFEKVTLMLGLIEIQGAPAEYEALDYLNYKCK
jgi:hypothetical protein